MRTRDGSRGLWAMAAKAMRAVVAMAVVGVACSSGGRAARGAETAGPTPAGTPEAAQEISAADYLAAVAKPGMTDAERAAFAAKHEGSKVTWTGYVRAVSRNKSPDGDSFLLILKEKPVSDPPPAAFVAWLGMASEAAVEALKEDQKVSVSGTLFVKSDPTIPQLKDAKLAQ